MSRTPRDIKKVTQYLLAESGKIAMYKYSSKLKSSLRIELLYNNIVAKCFTYIIRIKDYQKLKILYFGNKINQRTATKCFGEI